MLSLFDVIGQSTHKLDSLLRIIENQKEDTNKVKTLLLISQEYDKIADFNKCLEYCDYSYDLAFRLNYTAGKVDALLSRSDYLFKTRGKLNADGSMTYYPGDTSFQLAQIALKMSDSINDFIRKAASFTMLGRIFLWEEGPSSARKYFYDAYNLYLKIGDSVEYMNFLRRFGNFYKKQAKYDSAIYCFDEYLKYCEKLNIPDYIGNVYYVLGETYYVQADFNNAKYCYKESIKFYNMFNYMKDDIFVKQAYLELSLIARDENKIDELLNYYLEQCSELKNNYRQGVLKNLIGMIFFDIKKDFYNAIEYYSESRNLFEKTVYKSEYLEACEGIAYSYFYLNNFNKALKILDSILYLYKDPQANKSANETYYYMRKIYEQTGNYQKAYEIYKMDYNLNDSIIKRNYEEDYIRLKGKYHDKIYKERLLSLENEKISLVKNLELRKRTMQRNAYLYSGSGLILIVSLTFIFYRNKAIKDKIITFQKIHQLEEEKKLLAARVIVEGQEEERIRIARELDDGLGALLSKVKMQFNVVKEKSPENKLVVEKATKLIDQASGDIRKISYNMMPAMLIKFGLYDTLINLFDSLNHIEGINANLNIDGKQTRSPENIEIMIYRFIQEMVNNTLKHAGAKNINLDIHFQSNEIKLEYYDDGKGFDPNVKLIAGSIGLKSIQSRVKFINGEINLKSKPGQGVNYTVRIPLT